MRIYLNEQEVELPTQELAIDALLELRGLPQKGMAVAINNQVVRKDMWSSTYLKQDDKVVIIAAAFGG